MNKFKVGDWVVSFYGEGEILRVEQEELYVRILHGSGESMWLTVGGLLPEDKFFAALDEFHKEDENEKN